MMTLRDALAWVRDYGASVELCAGASGEYGAEGQRISAAALLAALPADALARRATLVWDDRAPGYVYTAGDPLGWIHVFIAPGKADQTPALFIMQRSTGSEGSASSE